ncbi:exopolyphosphatase-like protein [Podospora fimiseda]|uniref:Exopolyphosphatase-like protein n=1 Tax=Podospora fimiseda TaxID=252190 RepID=A0AAN7BPN5_9PEZI|nr:exopolyphosphatase-like protein [Podospora fimiseda]
MSTPSLKLFLGKAKKAISTLPSSSPLTFVVGNESADLDSLCSALLYAYFRTNTPPYTLHIPLSNLPKADLTLRPELSAVCRSAGLSTSDLITLSDLPRDSQTGKILLKAEETRWLLVDHNVLTGPLTHFSKQVIGCVDHHEDENAVPQNCSPRVFAKCGSCMSLIIDQCKDVWSSLDSKDNETNASLAAVAMAPILIDTTNLTSKDKTTDWDLKAAEFVQSKISDSTQIQIQRSEDGSGAGPFDRKGYYDHLTKLKDDIDSLSYRDILRKDYKRWSDGGLSLGISTVVQGFDYVLGLKGDDEGKGKFLEALKGWAEEQELDIAAVMTVSKPDGVFTRELLVWGLNKKAVKVLKQFVKENGEDLDLNKWKGGELDESEGTDWRVCWRQNNIKHSRKQVAPMLREAMKESSRL